MAHDVALCDRAVCSICDAYGDGYASGKASAYFEVRTRLDGGGPCARMRVRTLPPHPRRDRGCLPGDRGGCKGWKRRDGGRAGTRTRLRVSGVPAAASHNRYHADASVGGFGSFTCPQPGQAITRPLSTSRPHTRIDGGGVLDRHRGRSCPGGNRAMRFYTETRTTGWNSERCQDVQAPTGDCSSAIPSSSGCEPGRGGEHGWFGEAGGIEGGAAQGLGQGANPPVSRYES